MPTMQSRYPPENVRFRQGSVFRSAGVFAVHCVSQLHASFSGRLKRQLVSVPKRLRAAAWAVSFRGNSRMPLVRCFAIGALYERSCFSLASPLVCWRPVAPRPEPNQAEGVSLLDQMMVFFGSNLHSGSSHATTNLPLLLAGGGFKIGRAHV